MALIDLRSDTATLPTPAMRRAMADADLGDDMLGEDPTVNRLEETIAGLLGKEAAMFVPSGTMSNQIALKVHTRPGDEVLCESEAHIYLYEGGAPAALSGIMCQLVPGRKGIVDVGDFEGRVRPRNIHHARTRLVALENTHNKGNGNVLPLENIQRIGAWAKAEGLAFHLDGARLFNAVAKSGVPADQWAAPFDTVSVCFSKGLGAPVGSALVASKDFLAEARRARKILGGAMRQAGVLAAAALYALEHNRERLSEDHANAALIATAAEQSGAFALTAADVPTNILWMPLRPGRRSAAEWAAALREQGILAGAYGPAMLRMVTHLGVSRADTVRVADALTRLAQSF